MREFIAWLFWPAFVALTRYMGRCGFILYGWGKGDDPDPVDYTPMAQASAEAARIGKELSEKQLAENKRQYDNNMAVAAPVIEAQIGLMKSQQQIGDDFNNYAKTTFRPIEQSLADDAAKFSTEGSKEAFARSALADLEQQQTNEDAQSNRALMAMGVNPNSAKFVALKKQSDLTSAAARAGVLTGARERADAISTAKRMEVAGLGRGLAGTAQGSYSLALNAGNSAVGNQNQTSAQYLNGMAAGNGTIMQGQQQQISGLGSILNSQSSAFSSGAQSAAADRQGTGQLIGVGVSAAIAI